MQCIYCIMKQGLVPRALNKEGTHLKDTFFNAETTPACRLDATIERSLDGNSAFRYTPDNRRSDDHRFPAPIAAFPNRDHRSPLF